ncbi:hypothetical protein BKH42_04135 [Helicobacter sp. 13S00482-2]|uniref:hypothetical protein n=1 Tax=Helicobacter sp. 13S00482-2 TaxID=1476200 RepID=UPI000BA6E331|nr:hypothetical protein [Helicobacter sp. 13S00482-2]PAF53694.1 hypothetical protein BKH42_04135 [Helicobacter sp. 13S00482-2]
MKLESIKTIFSFLKNMFIILIIGLLIVNAYLFMNIDELNSIGIGILSGAIFIFGVTIVICVSMIVKKIRELRDLN